MAELKTDSWFSLSTGMFIHNNFETKGEEKEKNWPSQEKVWNKDSFNCLCVWILFEETER